MSYLRRIFPTIFLTLDWVTFNGIDLWASFGYNIRTVPGRKMTFVACSFV